MWMFMVIMLLWKIMCMTSQCSPRNYRKNEVQTCYLLGNKFLVQLFFSVLSHHVDLFLFKDKNGLDR